MLFCRSLFALRDAFSLLFSLKSNYVHRLILIFPCYFPFFHLVNRLNNSIFDI